MFSQGESDVEIALCDGLAHAIIHENHENPTKASLYSLPL